MNTNRFDQNVVFWNVLPCIPVVMHRRFGKSCCIRSNLWIEAADILETSIPVYQATRCRFQEGSHFHTMTSFSAAVFRPLIAVTHSVTHCVNCSFFVSRHQ
jgi:hypothetical protein